MNNCIAHSNYVYGARIYVDEEDETESTCMWCKQSGFDILYEIIG